jgi:hypothetical protein
METTLEAHCLLASQLALANLSYASIETALLSFRLWAKLQESAYSAAPAAAAAAAAGGNGLARTERPRRHVWKAYFNLLSIILSRGLHYPSPVAARESLGREGAFEGLGTRMQLFVELQRVQGNYERLLQREVYFPKAEEYNQEIDEWVGTVMQNWRVLHGSRWLTGALAEGGRAELGRGVLEVRLLPPLLLLMSNR